MQAQLNQAAQTESDLRAQLARAAQRAEENESAMRQTRLDLESFEKIKRALNI